ncbi:transcription factor HES-4-like [Liolophura sinensis]|uniref:transcription factor HES-4-like n=1 Tax=Liolophura sinensis TaxID=3198878 RepID=UPI00315806EA
MNRDNGSTYKRENFNRKNNKQIMEKKRRARINSCLSELKTLVLKGLKKEETDFAKLEKADILEMTVTYLKNSKNQHRALESRADRDLAKYRAGFNECAKHAFSYIGASSHVHSDTKLHLMEHLADVLYTKGDSTHAAYKSECTMSKSPAIKREVLSPPPGHIHASAFATTNLLPLPACLDHGRSSPQMGDLFPLSGAYADIQSLNLKDMQATTPEQHQADWELIDFGRSSSPNTQKVRGEDTSQKLTAPAQDSMWRPW